MQKSLAQAYAVYAGLLALVALLLAGAGIYGVMAYLVNQRVPEIGIRMALGAKSMDVLTVIAIDGLRPAFAGMAIGMAGAARDSSGPTNCFALRVMPCGSFAAQRRHRIDPRRP